MTKYSQSLRFLRCGTFSFMVVPRSLFEKLFRRRCFHSLKLSDLILHLMAVMQSQKSSIST